MTKFIGRLFNVGIAKEVARGTGVATTYWLPTTDMSLDEKVDMAKFDASLGVIENQSDADVVKKYAEGKFEGIVDSDALGLLFNLTFGTVVVTGPTDSAYTHTFNVLENNTHPSFTINASEPNALAGASNRYPLAMVNGLELNMEVGKYPTYSMSFVSNVGSSTTSTVSYTVPKNFKPQQGTIKIADLFANIASGTSYTVRKINLNIAKNTEDDDNIGSTSSTDRLNKQFGATGSLELTYNSREFIDTVLLGNLSRAMQVVFTNTDVLIGAGTRPSVTINMYKVKFTEVAKKISNDDIVTMTVNFEGFYSQTDSKMISAVLVNTVTSY